MHFSFLKKNVKENECGHPIPVLAYVSVKEQTFDLGIGQREEGNFPDANQDAEQQDQEHIQRHGDVVHLTQPGHEEPGIGRKYIVNESGEQPGR
jgi:hypothetical protein